MSIVGRIGQYRVCFAEFLRPGRQLGDRAGVAQDAWRQAPDIPADLYNLDAAHVRGKLGERQRQRRAAFASVMMTFR